MLQTFLKTVGKLFHEELSHSFRICACLFLLKCDFLSEFFRIHHIHRFTLINTVPLRGSYYSWTISSKASTDGVPIWVCLYKGCDIAWKSYRNVPLVCICIYTFVCIHMCIYIYTYKEESCSCRLQTSSKTMKCLCWQAKLAQHNIALRHCSILFSTILPFCHWQTRYFKGLVCHFVVLLGNAARPARKTASVHTKKKYSTVSAWQTCCIVYQKLVCSTWLEFAHDQYTHLFREHYVF